MNKRTAAIVALALVASTSAWAESNPADPYEGYNRFMFKVNDTADRYVLTPVVRGYRAVTPSPVRTGVSNFYNNLRDVVSFGSNILRLDIKRASEDLVRVGINTTFGLGGLIDIAGAGEMPNNKKHLGRHLCLMGLEKQQLFCVSAQRPLNRARQRRHHHRGRLSAGQHHFPQHGRAHQQQSHQCRQHAREPARSYRQPRFRRDR